MTNSRSKKLLLVLLSVVAFLMSCAFCFNTFTAKADGEPVFEMLSTAEARIATPSGLRFKVKMNEATKTSIESAVENPAGKFGFIIAPTSLFADSDYISMSQKVLVDGNVENIYADPLSDDYLANVVLCNIRLENWDLKYSAVAYYTADGTSYTYATNIPSKSISEIVNAGFIDDATLEADRTDLFNAFNIGGTTSFVSEYDFNGNSTIEAEEQFTVAPKAVAISSVAEFGKMVAINDSTAYAYKLTADLTMVDGTSASLYDTFKGTLDGNGHSISYDITRSSGRFTGLFHKVVGTVKNLLVQANVKTFRDDNYAFIRMVEGSVENCVIYMDISTSTSGVVEEDVSRDCAAFGEIHADSTVKNVVIFDKTNGVHNLIADYASPSNTKFEKIAYIGTNAHANSGGWSRVPISLGTDTDAGKLPTISSFYMYPSYEMALAGKGYQWTGISGSATGNKENYEGASANYSSVTDVVISTATDFAFDYSAYDYAANTCTTRVKLAGATLFEIPGKIEQEIATAEEFIRAMTTGHDGNGNTNYGKYRLTADITIKDKALDSNSNIQSNTHMFYQDNSYNKTAMNFAGVLNGNKHKLTIDVEQDYTDISINPYRVSVYESASVTISGGTVFKGLFNEFSGEIKYLQLDMDVSTVYYNYPSSYLALTFDGTMRDCIFNLFYEKCSGSGYYNQIALVNTLGANAVMQRCFVEYKQIENVSNYRYHAFAVHAASTAKIQNMALAGMDGNLMTYILPQERCDCDNIAIYSTTGRATWNSAGNIYAWLDSTKYDKASVANVSFDYQDHSSIWPSEIEVLYNMSQYQITLASSMIGRDFFVTEWDSTAKVYNSAFNDFDFYTADASIN